MMQRKPTYIILLIIVTWLQISSVAFSQSIKKISPASFSALGGGEISSFNGCFINRPIDSPGDDGDMYAGLDLPVGSTITGITAHFWDWAQSQHIRPLLMLRKYQGAGTPVILATAQNTMPLNGPFFYEQDADVNPDYVVQNGDFFDLIFIAGEQIINSYYICGVEIQYIPVE